MKRSKKMFYVVNAFTLSRIIGSIFLFPIYFNCGPKIVGIILTIFFLTDWIDGYLARKFNVCTFFGSIMDTVCDKLILIVSCAILCFINPYFIFSIICEVLIVIISAFNLTQENTAKATMLGRTKMWVLCMCVIAGFIFSKEDHNLLNFLILLPALIFEIFTICQYLFRLFDNKIVIKKERPKIKSAKDIKTMLFSPEFYDKHKDQKGLLNNIYESEK